MRFISILSISAILLLIPIFARAEVIDHRDSRREYARSVSQLEISKDRSAPSGPQARKSSPPSVALVLFRTSEGTPDFGEYAPDVLVLGPHGCFTAAYADELTALAAIGHLQSLPEIIYAELDGEVCACDEAADPAGGERAEAEEQYGFHSYGASEMGFGKAARWCGKAGMGQVTVAVIDSGVYPHPFLAARLGVSGFDYVDGDEDATNDAYGHGTHVAGIIVDCTPELPVYIRPIRVLNASGKGSIANTTSAIFEAAEAGCGVINLSLTAATHSEALEDAVRFALNRGSSVVAAAGNNADSTDKYCPVHLEDAGLIVVGACAGSIDAPVRASYSNYGASVDVFAFGTSIRSCSPSGGYVSRTGTSQAAPHISALCAILRRLFPSVGCGQIESRVKALSVAGSAGIPNAALLVPQTMGVSAEDIYLPAGAQIRLLPSALPETSFIGISWRCEDDQIAAVSGSGVLTCLKEGVTVLHGEGSANVSVSANLHVFADDSVFRLPSAVTSVEAEAFAGTAAKAVYLPENIRAFDGDSLEQSNLKTVFYSGGNMLFEDLQGLKGEICIVTDRQKSLWRALEDAGVDYLIYCEE